MEEKEVFKVPPKEVQQAVIDRVLMRLEARHSSSSLTNSRIRETSCSALFSISYLRVVKNPKFCIFALVILIEPL